MARRCSICAHQRRAGIDKAIVAGESTRQVCMRFGISESALRRHRRAHFPAPAKTGNQQAGRFRKGQSGNPRGRPQGSRNRASIVLEKIMADDGKEVVKAVLEAAKNGDTAAARLILDRICPLPKGRLVWLHLPKIVTAEDVLVAHSAITDAMAKGTITPDEATTIAGLLEAKRKVIETIEIEARLATLEKQLMDDQ